jgi:hypothetical protein
MLPSGNNLLLCGHHLGRHRAKLDERNAVIMPLAAAAHAAS